MLPKARGGSHGQLETINAKVKVGARGAGSELAGLESAEVAERKQVYATYNDSKAFLAAISHITF